MIYLFFQVRPQDIVSIKNIVESYENMMDMSTIDKTLPKIQITLAPDFKEDGLRVIANLQKTFLMIPIADNPTISQGNY